MASGHSRIGIIGTGAIGGFYGLMLARAGQDVHFLLRSEYAAVTARGLRVESQVHGALQLDSVQAYRQAADMPPCDWLFVAAKTTSNAALAPAIVQAAAPGAKVVLLQNGLGVEDALRPLLRDDMHLLGGLCAICAHRAEPGVVVHQALGAVNLGYHTGPADAEQRQRIVDEGVALFRAAGIDSTGMPSLAQARWMKLIWNAAFNGLSVLLDADTRTLLPVNSSGWSCRRSRELHRRAATHCRRQSRKRCCKGPLRCLTTCRACITIVGRIGRWSSRPFMPCRWRRLRRPVMRCREPKCFTGPCVSWMQPPSRRADCSGATLRATAGAGKNPEDGLCSRLYHSSGYKHGR